MLLNLTGLQNQDLNTVIAMTPVLEANTFLQQTDLFYGSRQESYLVTTVVAFLQPQKGRTLSVSKPFLLSFQSEVLTFI